jgi:hypothetical protein
VGGCKWVCVCETGISVQQQQHCARAQSSSRPAHIRPSPTRAATIVLPENYNLSYTVVLLSAIRQWHCAKYYVISNRHSTLHVWFTHSHRSVLISSWRHELSWTAWEQWSWVRVPRIFSCVAEDLWLPCEKSYEIPYLKSQSGCKRSCKEKRN